MTEDLIDRIIRHEGFCAFPKLDAKGFWEVGYGHDLPGSQAKDWKKGITPGDALAMLKKDLESIKEKVALEFPWILGLDDCRVDVIYEMCYQMGLGGVSQFKNMIAAIRMQDWDKAADAMLASQWHKETPSRCEELANLMLKGDS